MIFDRNAGTRRAQLLPPVAFTAFSGASMFWREIQTFLSEKEGNGQSNASPGWYLVGSLYWLSMFMNMYVIIGRFVKKMILKESQIEM